MVAAFNNNPWVHPQGVSLCGLGLRAAFMIDYASPDLKFMTLFLNNVLVCIVILGASLCMLLQTIIPTTTTNHLPKRSGYFKNSGALCAMQMDHFVFVINTTLLAEKIERDVTARFASCHFVNINKSLPHPHEVMHVFLQRSLGGGVCMRFRPLQR